MGVRGLSRLHETAHLVHLLQGLEGGGHGGFEIGGWQGVGFVVLPIKGAGKVCGKVRHPVACGRTAQVTQQQVAQAFQREQGFLLGMGRCGGIGGGCRRRLHGRRGGHDHRMGGLIGKAWGMALRAARRGVGIAAVGLAHGIADGLDAGLL